MAEWQTVRFDPTYSEPLDAEIIPLLDAMNAAGFVTVSSCCGHGGSWPYVHFKDTDTRRIEALARFVMERERGDFRPSFTRWQRELVDPADVEGGYLWGVEIHLNDMFADTPHDVALGQAVAAINELANRVTEFASQSDSQTPPPASSSEDVELMRDVAFLLDAWKNDGLAFDDHAAAIRERVANWNRRAALSRELLPTIPPGYGA